MPRSAKTAYFSDWLACTESRRYQPDGGLIRQPVPLHRTGETLKTTLNRADGSTEDMEVPPSLPLPTNLVITGTVNVARNAAPRPRGHRLGCGRLRALDAAILQKVLPRLSGSRAKLEAPLATLCTYLKDLSRPG